MSFYSHNVNKCGTNHGFMPENVCPILRLFYPSDHYRFCVILSVSFATAFIEDHYESGTEQSADIAELEK